MQNMERIIVTGGLGFIGSNLINLLKNKYFIITAQITKMWDSSWDIITNPLYQDIPYDSWQQKDCFDIIHDQTNSDQEIKLTPLHTSKFAGWIDLVNKKTYEELIPVWDTWEGYGGWDYYGMIVTDNFKQLGGDFQQYLIEGQTIVEWTTGFVGHPLVNSYKKFLQDMLDIRLQYRDIAYKNNRNPVAIDMPYLRHPPHQASFIIPEYLLHYVQEQIDFMEDHREPSTPGQEYTGFYDNEIYKLRRIYNIIKAELDSGNDNTTNRKDFVLFVDEHDRRRGTNFLETFPDMSEFYNYCKEL